MRLSIRAGRFSEVLHFRVRWDWSLNPWRNAMAQYRLGRVAEIRGGAGDPQSIQKLIGGYRKKAFEFPFKRSN